MLFPVRPVPKPRMTQSDKWRHGEYGKWRVRDCVKRYHEYQDMINIYRKDYELPNSFTVVFGMPFPKRINKTKRAQLLGQPHLQKPDVDNLLKAIMDTLKTEDQTVWHVDARKVWATGEGFISIEENEDNKLEQLQS